VRDPRAASALLRLLVVDDEPLARERLVRLIAGIEGATLAGEAENARAALAQIAKLLPDVLLLDVEMPGMNGLALAATPGIPPIIFTTAHVNLAAEAFDVDAVDFLSKPVRAERLERALERARRRIAAGAAHARAPAQSLAVHDAGTIQFVDPTSVPIFRARDKYTEFTRDGEELLVRESLDGLEARLGDRFVRVHRAALVRRDAIRELAHAKDGMLVVLLVDGTSVAVSRRAAPRLRRSLGVRK
jgi:DNA-binding LytR/AlgR family response regulator